MQLHTHYFKRKKSRIRIGRGGKRGTYSGRGLKGQKSRAGRRIRPAIRDFISRLPKRRGSRMKIVRQKPRAVTLRAVAHLSGTLDHRRLAQEGILSFRYRGEVKLIGSHRLSNPLTVKGLKVSEGARKQIVSAGGKVL